jgi:ketosteroid isomerase-like protein
MGVIDRIDDRLAIARLNSDFGHALDRGDVEDFVTLFRDDAVYTHGPRVLRGHPELRRFFLDRRSAGPRTSRHVTSDLRIDFEANDRARGVSICTTYSAPRAAPVDSTLPAVVADFEDVYLLSAGRWRIAERRVLPLFRHGEPR